MRVLLLAAILTVVTAGLGAQTPGWEAPAQAEASARALGKPVLLLWQAGPGAPEFTEGVDRLFSSWPAWGRQAALVSVFARARAWEGPLPPDYPELPDGGASSALVLWVPGSPRNPTVWTAVPAVLELSHRLAETAGRPLEEPYDVDVTAFQWDDWTLTRSGRGPVWTAVGPEGTSVWVEEGPVGTVLVMDEPSTGRRAAFPLDGEWSYLFDPGAQTWGAWNTVVAKRP